MQKIFHFLLQSAKPAEKPAGFVLYPSIFTICILLLPVVPQYRPAAFGFFLLE